MKCNNKKQLTIHPDSIDIKNFNSYKKGFLYDYSNLNNYHLWSQDQYPWGPGPLGQNRRYGAFGCFGCYVTALSKIAVESGINSSFDINPLKLHNRFNDINEAFPNKDDGSLFTNESVLASFGAISIETLDYPSNKKYILEKLADHNENYQVVLINKKSNGGLHYFSVNKAASIIKKDIYIDNSIGSGGGRSEDINDLYNNYEVAPQMYPDGGKIPYEYYANVCHDKIATSNGNANITTARLFKFSNNEENKELIFYSKNCSKLNENHTVSNSVGIFLFPTNNSVFRIGKLNRGDVVRVSYIGTNSHDNNYYMIKGGEYAGCYFSEELTDTLKLAENHENGQ